MYGELAKRFVRSNAPSREAFRELPENVLQPASTTVPVRCRCLKGFAFQNKDVRPGAVVILPRWLFDDLFARQRVEKLNDEP